MVAAWVRITALDTRDTPFKNFDRFLNPYAEDNGANKGGRHIQHRPPSTNSGPNRQIPTSLQNS